MTRIGIIADIHGNVFALKRVLSELDRIGVDEIVCLGDVAVLGPDPAAVVGILRKRGVQTVCGNTDSWLCAIRDTAVDPPTSTESIALTEWTKQQLSDKDRTWLDGLPNVLKRKIHGNSMCFCHGSPVGADDIIVTLPPERVGEFGFDVIVGGHTHQQTDVRIRQVRYLNPGSAGLPGVGPGEGIPIHHQATWVEFAVLEVSDTGITWEPQRVELDIRQTIERARKSGMPHLDWWTSRWG